MRYFYSLSQILIFLVIITLANSVKSQNELPKVKLSTSNKISLVPLYRDIDMFPYTTINNTKIQFLSYILSVQDVNNKPHTLLNWDTAYGDQPGFYSPDNNGKRAVINILYIGLDAHTSLNDIYINQTNGQPDLAEYVKSVLQTGNYWKSNSTDYNLLVYQLDKESQLKTWIKKHTPLHSTTVFALVSSKDIWNLPPLFSSEQYAKLRFSVNRMSKRLVVQIPPKVQNIRYKLGFINSTYKDETLTPLKNYIEFDSNIHSTIQLFKPFGYNLVFKNEPDTIGMINPSREINYFPGDTLFLKPVKFSLIYIDPTRSNKMEVVDQLDKISRSSTSFHAYLSVKNKLYEAVDYEGIKKLAGLIYNQVSESAIIDKDMDVIGKSKELIDMTSRMDIDAYLFLPDEVYEENLNMIKGRFTNMLATRKANCKISYNVFVSEDQRGFVTDNNNTKYYFLKND